jgi:phosphohistidine phosphatase
LKKILFIRHAKSSWDDPDLLDIDRPLKNRGFNDAELMSKVISELDFKLDFMLCSPALRTIQTAEIFREKTFRESDFKIEHQLYGSSRSDYYQIIQGLDDKYSKIALIGHNPDISYAASELCNKNIILPTTGIALLEFNKLKWAEVAAGTAELVFFGSPKSYR